MWILEDYANRRWVYKYKGNIEFDLRTYLFEYRDYNKDIKLLAIRKDELILDWKEREIFLR